MSISYSTGKQYPSITKLYSFAFHKAHLYDSSTVWLFSQTGNEPAQENTATASHDLAAVIAKFTVKVRAGVSHSARLKQIASEVSL